MSQCCKLFLVDNRELELLARCNYDIKLCSKAIAIYYRLMLKNLGKN